MNKPTRIRFNRFEGKPLPPRSILATRPGRWGNLFNWKEGVLYLYTESEAKRLVCIEFEQWLKTGLPSTEYFKQMVLSNKEFYDNRRQWILSHLHLIREAEHVACTCKLDETCHVDVLIELAMAEVGNGN